MKIFKSLSLGLKIFAIASIVGIIIYHVFIGIGIFQIVTNSTITDQFDMESGVDHVNVTIPLIIRNPGVFPITLSISLEIENTTQKILDFTSISTISTTNPLVNLTITFYEADFMDFFYGWNDTLNMVVISRISYALYELSLQMNLVGVDFG